MATPVCGHVCASWQPAEKHSVYLFQNKPLKSLPTLKGKGNWRHNIYKTLLWMILLPSWLLHKKWHHAQMTQSVQIKCLLAMKCETALCRLDSTLTFLYRSLAATFTSTCTCLTLLSVSVQAFGTRAVPISRSLTVDFPPPISQPSN